MEKLVYVDRRNTNCNKWDGQQKMFGEEGLHAMWVADMDFRVPECVVSALREYVESGVYGYYKIPDAYYQAFIDWEREHHGYEVKKEWIRFSPGVVAGFHWLLQILTEENDAVISPKIYYYDNKDIIWSAGADMRWKKGVTDQRGINQKDDGSYDKREKVEFGTGCCLLIPSKVIKEVGYLADDYFLYYEDTDYCMRIREKRGQHKTEGRL